MADPHNYVVYIHVLRCIFILLVNGGCFLYRTVCLSTFHNSTFYYIYIIYFAYFCIIIKKNILFTFDVDFFVQNIYNLNYNNDCLTQVFYELDSGNNQNGYLSYSIYIV